MTMKLSNNQKRVLRAFQRTGILTLAELRRTSPYWNQAIRCLCDKLYLAQRLNDGRYAITQQGGAALAQLQWEESPEGIAELTGS
jgi:hypothetical protein